MFDNGQQKKSPSAKNDTKYQQLTMANAIHPVCFFTISFGVFGIKARRKIKCWKQLYHKFVHVSSGRCCECYFFKDGKHVCIITMLLVVMMGLFVPCVPDTYYLFDRLHEKCASSIFRCVQMLLNGILSLFYSKCWWMIGHEL